MKKFIISLITLSLMIPLILSSCGSSSGSSSKNKFYGSWYTVNAENSHIIQLLDNDRFLAFGGSDRASGKYRIVDKNTVHAILKDGGDEETLELTYQSGKLIGVILEDGDGDGKLDEYDPDVDEKIIYEKSDGFQKQIVGLKDIYKYPQSKISGLPSIDELIYLLQDQPLISPTSLYATHPTLAAYYMHASDNFYFADDKEVIKYIQQMTKDTEKMTCSDIFDCIDDDDIRNWFLESYYTITACRRLNEQQLKELKEKEIPLLTVMLKNADEIWETAGYMTESASEHKTSKGYDFVDREDEYFDGETESPVLIIKKSGKYYFAPIG